MTVRKLLSHPLLKTSVIYTLCDAVNKAVPFLILPFLSYYLAPSDYGIIANFNVLLSIVTIFITIGVDGAIGVNYYKFSKKELSVYIFNSLILVVSIAAGVSILLVIFQNQIFYWIKVPVNIQFLTIIMALCSAITAINLSLWRLEEKALFFGTYEISQTIINIGASLILIIVYRTGWIGRVNGMLLAACSFGAFSLYLLFIRGYLKVDFNKVYLKEIIFFGLPIIPHALSFWIRSGVDRIFITRFINETATGLYATGFQFGILISFLTLSFNNAFAPYIYKSLSEKNEDSLKANKFVLVKLTYLAMALLILFCIVFTFFSNFVLTHFFSINYIHAKDFVFWAILSQTFQGMYLLFVNYIFFVKKTKSLAIITFGCALLQILISFILIPYFGAIGAAYSTAIVSFINFVAVAIYSYKIFEMPWFSSGAFNFAFLRR